MCWDRRPRNFKGLWFDEVHADCRLIRERTGYTFIPMLLTPDDEAWQDSTYIYDRLEERHPEPKLFPATPVQRIVARLVELDATINERLVREVAPMRRDKPPDGTSLRERAASLVADRVALYERVGSYMRATVRNRDRSASLSAEYRKLVLGLREQLLRWPPELRGAPADLVEALDQATSTYDAIRLGREPDPRVPATIRERAWSSPIWIDPPS